MFPTSKVLCYVMLCYGIMQIQDATQHHPLMKILSTLCCLQTHSVYCCRWSFQTYKVFHPHFITWNYLKILINSLRCERIWECHESCQRETHTHNKRETYLGYACGEFCNWNTDTNASLPLQLQSTK